MSTDDEKTPARASCRAKAETRRDAPSAFRSATAMRPSAELPAPDYLLAALTLSEAERAAIKTYGDALALSQFRAGSRAKRKRPERLLIAVDGKARQPIELSGPGGDPLELVELLVRGRARAAQMKASEPKVDP